MSASVTDRGARVSISDRQTEVLVSVLVTDRGAGVSISDRQRCWCQYQ